MGKPLSDEELRSQVADKMAYTMYGNSFDAIGADKRSRIAVAIVEMTQFINTQKRLYAESVIGQHNATYNNEMGINDASAGAISMAVDDTIRAIKSNPSNENQIRYTKWLTEEVVKYVDKGVAAKAQYDLIEQQRARIDL